MKTTLPRIAADYVKAVNDHDAVAFIRLFAPDAVADDAGRVFRGIDEIKSWSDRDIFEANVVLEVLAAEDSQGDVVVTTKVDGTFDRTGLPDPLVMQHRLEIKGDKILALECRLATAPATT